MPTAQYLENARRRLLSRTDTSGDCWLWTGATGGAGYGLLAFEGKTPGAHRVSWMVHNGPIPDGMVVAHRCDVRLCVNPRHLFLTTQLGNMEDMRQKARESRGESHSAAIKAGWTPEVRERMSATHRDRLKVGREQRAKAAGVPLDWKHCAKCDEWKPPAEYVPNTARAGGLSSYCRACERERIAAYQRRRRAAARTGR